jgi:single-stranded DNA-binding protein
MNNTTETSNRIEVIGTVVSALEFTHEIIGERFYNFRVSTKRLSGNADIITATISERLLSEQSLHEGQKVTLKGQVRTYNKVEHGRSSLMITLFVTDYAICDEGIRDNEEVELTGFICKEPIYRTTPFGREICDIILAVNRAYNKSDYIPVITWGRNAKFCSKMKVGTAITIFGRLQSREYQKQLSNGAVVTRVAYEISVARVIRKDA